jgi:inorganic pyrophosphatase
MIGFGQNVGQNIFDQNRLGVLFGWRFNKNVKIEGGYFSQILQLARSVNSQNVFQYNTGFIVNTVWNLDLNTQ